MNLKTIAFLFVFTLSIAKANFKDSLNKSSFRIIVGLNYQNISNYLAYGTNKDGVAFDGDTKFDKLSLIGGLVHSYKLTPRKKLENSVFYCDGYLPYMYETIAFDNTILVSKTGKIDFNTLGINSNINYRVWRFFNVHYGLNLSYIVYNKFDDIEVAKRINWINADGESQIRIKLNFGMNLGFGFDFLKRFRFEYNFNKGFTRYIKLHVDNYQSNFVAQNIVGTSFTLSYNFNVKN